MTTTKPQITAMSRATEKAWILPLIISLINNTEYVTGFNFATNASQFGNNSRGKSAGLSINNGMPRKLITPQKVS